MVRTEKRPRRRRNWKSLVWKLTSLPKFALATKKEEVRENFTVRKMLPTR